MDRRVTPMSHVGARGRPIAARVGRRFDRPDRRARKRRRSARSAPASIRPRSRRFATSRSRRATSRSIASALARSTGLVEVAVRPERACGGADRRQRRSQVVGNRLEQCGLQGVALAGDLGRLRLGGEPVVGERLADLVGGRRHESRDAAVRVARAGRPRAPDRAERRARRPRSGPGGCTWPPARRSSPAGAPVPPMCSRTHWAGSSPGMRRRTQWSVPPGGGGVARERRDALAARHPDPSAIQSESMPAACADDLGDLRQDSGRRGSRRERAADEEQLARLSLPVLRGRACGSAPARSAGRPRRRRRGAGRG